MAVCLVFPGSARFLAHPPGSIVGVRHRVAVVSHVYGNGPAQPLVTYLRRTGQSYVFIAHPFLFTQQRPSYIERQDTGGPLTRRHSPFPIAPIPFRYLQDLLTTILWLLQSGPIDTVVGCGNINAMAGLVLRLLRRAKTVVFYSVDYVPQRFDGSFLNRTYSLLDRHVARACDRVWNLSPAMEHARMRADPARLEIGRMDVVPMGGGFDLDTVETRPNDSSTIAFVGHLLDKQGVQIALEALPMVKAALPEARLVVMGDGPYGSALRRLASDLALDDSVEFTGFMSDFEEVRRRLAASALGIALYVGELDRWTRYADPGKLKDYLAAGLPILTTAVPPNARYLEERGAAIIVEPTPDEVAAALIRILTDAALRRSMAWNARRLAREYDWTRIFSEAFAKLRGEGRTARSSFVHGPLTNGGQRSLVARR